MIQRVQSILLVLAIACSCLLFAEPVFRWHSETPSVYETGVLETTIREAEKTDRVTLNWPSLLLNCLIIFMTFYTLFAFKNRVRQARMSHFLFLLQLILVILVLYNWDTTQELAGNEYKWKVTFAMIFLVLPALLFLAARHFIKKDEALVRSADRLR